MKKLFTAFAFSGLLLAGCNSFYTKTEVTTCGECAYVDYWDQSGYKTIYYTNTSPDKYLEVTLKDGKESTFIKIKPGETIKHCAKCGESAPEVVGEREITNN